MDANEKSVKEVEAISTIAPYWTSPDGRHVIYLGDALTVLRELPDCSVQCCVTSPPYWGLRDYGTAKWEGGDDGCDHKQSVARRDGGRENVNGFHGSSAADSDKGAMNYRDVCGKCGARRIDAQLGLESTPAEYVEKMVAVFREVKRVLRDDGTLFLNLGDSYAATTKGAGGEGKQHSNAGSVMADRSWSIPDGLKPKDLVGIPWRVAFALQADGWYLRQDIIWAKPNPMPESVRDRCTKAHEYLFLLAKNERYYFDAAAIAEPFADERMGNPGQYAAGLKDCVPPMGVHGDGVTGQGWNADGAAKGRNKRSVWTVTTQPYKEAHFATFPPKLIEPCILAGAPAGGVILDPFNGSGTTGLVALEHGRHYVGIELSREYCAIAVKRLERELSQPCLPGLEPQKVVQGTMFEDRP